MLFRNARIYYFDTAEPPTEDALRSAAGAYGFTPCSAMQEEADGFAPLDMGTASPPEPDADPELVLQVNDALLVRHRLQQKILPASAVSELLDDRIERFEARTGRPPRAKERRDLKDELRAELMPRALTRSTLTWVLIDQREGWLAIDTPQGSRAERVLDTLRQALGTLSVVPLAWRDAPSAFLSSLILGDSNPSFVPGEVCRLTDPLHDVTNVSYRNADLTDSHLRGQIRTGLKPTAVELIWKSQLALILDTEPFLQRIRDLASPDDDAVDQEADGETALLGDLAVCHLTLRALLADLAEALGGVAVGSQPD